MRMRGLLYGIPRHRTLCKSFPGSWTTGQTGMVHQYQRPQILQFASQQKQNNSGKEKWQISEELPFGKDRVVPLMAGEFLDWKLK